MRILIVEDKKHIALAVAEVLKKSGLLVDLAHDGEYGLDCALTGIYDCIVLDIMLPKKDGLSALKEVRDAGIETPVILLTAKSELSDKVRGLDLGADDYLAKPFHTEELLARIRALTRRKPELRRNGTFSFADIELITEKLILRCREYETTLQPKDAQILELLIANQGQIVPKESILEKVWGYDTNAEYNHVEKHISLLRKKLSQSGAAVSVHTIRGIGYSLEKGGSTNAE
jgi:DNA-binding response OmpR family regulator